MAEVSIGKSTNDGATTDCIAKSSLPGSRNLAASTGITFTILASESWLGEEGVDQDEVITFHDDTC